MEHRKKPPREQHVGVGVVMIMNCSELHYASVFVGITLTTQVECLNLPGTERLKLSTNICTLYSVRDRSTDQTT